MKIGINLTFLYEITGIGVYVKNLLEKLGEIDKKNFFYIFTNKNFPKETFLNYPNFIYIRLPFNSKSNIKRIVFEQLILPFYLNKFKINLLFSPSVFNPLFSFCPKITVIHDVNYLDIKFGFLKRLYLKFVTFAAKNSKIIITVSNFSKKEIINRLKVNNEKVKVIYNSYPILPTISDDEKTRMLLKFKIKKPYFLYIGSIAQHKNIKNIVFAFRDFYKRHRNFKMVFAGPLVDSSLNFKQLKNEIDFSEEVLYLGTVSDVEKVALYKEANALIFPSLYEGFGLPILEAQSLGIPVLTSNLTAMPESGGEGALYVNPYNINEIVEKMEKIAFDEQLREELIKKGYENTKRFSWENGAKELLKIFYSVCAK